MFEKLAEVYAHLLCLSGNDDMSGWRTKFRTCGGGVMTNIRATLVCRMHIDSIM